MSNASQRGLPGPIDQAVYSALEEIAEGDAGFLAELLQQYLSDAEQLMATLREGVSGSDARRVEQASHTLKSASASIGAIALSDACHELQVMGRASDLAGARELVAAADDEYERVREELSQRLHKLGD